MAHGGGAPPSDCTVHCTGPRITMRVRGVSQLFDPADPSPMGQRDLSGWAEQYIVESAKECRPAVARELVILVDQVAVPAVVAHTVAGAVHAHFAHQADLQRRAFRRLMRRGAISLAIGIAFLGAFVGVSRVVAWAMGDGTAVTMLREGALIVGWVAMWRPLEIFLYDWWPIVGVRRLHERLSRLSVRVVAAAGENEGASWDGDGVRGAHDARGAHGAHDARTPSVAWPLQRWENEGGHIAVPPVTTPTPRASSPGEAR